MAELLLSLSGLVGVLAVFLGARSIQRRQMRKYLPILLPPKIANVAPTGMTLIASYGISSAEAVAGAEAGARAIREATD